METPSRSLGTSWPGMANMPSLGGRRRRGESTQKGSWPPSGMPGGLREAATSGPRPRWSTSPTRPAGGWLSF
eukprot:9527155-Alexandrium_andersonii.AAC.1